MHDDVTKAGRILRAARLAKGMTQEALSRKTGVATRTIIDIEKDKRHPTYEVLFKLLRALDFSADHIFWPERIQYTVEQEHLARVIASCDEHGKAAIIGIAKAVIHAVSGGDSK